MMLDYHIHTKRCGHATGEMAQYVAEAQNKKLSEIGFADHFPLDLLGYTPQAKVTMTGVEFPGYLAEIASLQQSSSLLIRTGVEVDYLPGREKTTAAALSTAPLDYIIGSLHFLDDWDFTHPRFAGRFGEMDVDDIFERYFTVVEDMAESGLFDIVGHLDVVKKFSYFPSRPWDNLVDKVCGTLKKNGLCVELNTAGWRAPVKEAYPSILFLEKFHALGIPVTLGSDAHCPEDVGAGIDQAVSLLKKIGFTEVASFSDRQLIMQSLGKT
jgi:histidinol-phosphatase (PHP family)